MKIELGDFFYHVEYKTGQVVSVSQDTPAIVEIQFFNRPLDRLSSRLLEQSSIKVSFEGFRAFAYRNREAAEKLIVENPVQVIILTLADFDGFYTKTEKIKDYLVPDFIKSADWETWWKATQQLLKNDPRIDTTHSRKREYALAKEQYSRAETDYVRFHSNRHLFSQDSLAELARSALKQQKEDQSLLPEHASEVTEYLNNIIYLDNYPISLRLETLFHMFEDKLISPEEYNTRLVRLLSTDIRLYDLKIFAARGVINKLLDVALSEHECKILATGICAEETISGQIISWASQNHNVDFIALMLITAFRENLSPTGRETFYQRLKSRFESCYFLLDYLLDSHPDWPHIYESFSNVTKSLAVAKPEEIDIVMPAFIKLVAEMERRASKIGVGLVDTFMESIVGPTLPIKFVLKVTDTCSKYPSATQLTEKMEDYLWSHNEERRDDLLIPLIGAIDEAPIERAVQIIAVIKQYPSQSLIDQAANLICNYCQKVGADETLQLLSSLNYLHNIQGDFSWKARLDDQREKAYLAMFQAVPSLSGMQDSSIIKAAKRYAQMQNENLLTERGESQETISRLKDYVEKLQRQLKDYETKIRELSSIQGVNVEETRFEERIRILRTLADIASEYEAFTINQPGDHRELEALIKGILNILARNKVKPMDAIGTQVTFSSAKHRIVDSTNITNGAVVSIIERGFLIKDHKDQIRLLKPALVSK